MGNGCFKHSPSSSSSTYFVSTRMKKVAPPPPGSSKQPPLSNGDLLRRLEAEATPHRPPMSCTPGEDCAFDELLEGRMDLEVVLPDRNTIQITVDRSTPMMDLLVHVATTNKISPSGHTIKVLSEEQHNVLYKPNTPIGSLDVNTVYIVPKSTVDIPVKRMPKLANQPFEQTFRLQVNLPRNQRMVLRVSPRITLAELKRQICNEKELDYSNHHLVHPAQPDTVLDLNSTLDIYGCAEISLLSNSGLRDSIQSLSTQLIAYPRMHEKERDKKGILRLFSRKRREVQVESNTNGVSSQGISPTRNETVNRDIPQPKHSTKRKPAPAPPIHSTSPPLVIQSSSSINSRPESEISAKTDELGSTVSHSRHSSDSSGYHEPSVFSDCSENKSPEASIVHGGNVLSGNDTTVCKDVPDCLNFKPVVAKDSSNLKTVPSCSSASIVSATRKRKAPQPPVPALPEVETPSSPEDQPPVDIVVDKSSVMPSTEKSPVKQGELERDTRARESSVVEEQDCLPPEGDQAALTNVSEQESEALNYFENVLHESETNGDDVLSCNLSFNLHNGACLEDNENATISHGALEVNSVEMKDVECVPDNSESTDSTEMPLEPGVVSAANASSLAPAAETVLESDTARPDEVFSDMLINAEREKASTDSDYYADLSSTSTDASEMPSVPLSKVTLLKETSGMQLSQATDVLDPVTDAPEECIDKMSDTAATPSVPDKELSLNVQNALDSVESSESKEVSEKDSSVQSADQTVENKVVVTPSSRKKLINFAMSCYKSEVEDIYNSEPQQTSLPEAIKNKNPEIKNTDQSLKKEILIKSSTLPLKSRQAPDVKIVPFEDRNCISGDAVTQQSVKGQVQQRCVELSQTNLPLTGRSASLYNLSPGIPAAKIKPVAEPTEFLADADGLKKTLSDQNVAQDIQPDEKSEFIEEQKRLHEEYLKLQVQFISWQKQLLNNQALLQNEQIVTQMSFPAFEQYKNELEKLPVALHETFKEHIDDLKTQSLPRPKSRPLIAKEQSRSETPPVIHQNSKSEERIYPNTPLEQEKAVMSDSGISTEETSDHSNVPSETIEEMPELMSASKSQTLPRPINKTSGTLETMKSMTLNRQVRPKSQAVSVTIGSWQQRNMTVPDINSANVASSRSMFQSLENIPSEQSKMHPPVPVQRRKARPLSVNKNEEAKPDDDKNEETPDVTSEDEATKVKNEVRNFFLKKSQEAAKTAPTPKEPEPVKQRLKSDHKSQTLDSSNRKRSTKPLVHLSSMKDETQPPPPPPPLHALKKWPLPEVTEKTSKKSVERSFWEEITASAKRPAGRTREKLTHAEVDLRKHRPAKSKPSSKSTSSDSEESASKIHVITVNINGNDASGNKPSDSDNVKSKPSKHVSSSVMPVNNMHSNNKSEPFNAELKNVLSKRASVMTESLDSACDSKEPTYAEAKPNQGKECKNVIQNDSAPPPPPPPVSTMPTIPPAAPIPKSSQLLMDKRTKGVTKQSQSKAAASIAPREELMLEIRGFGGRQALRKLLEKSHFPLLKKSPKKKALMQGPSTSSHVQ